MSPTRPGADERVFFLTGCAGGIGSRVSQLLLSGPGRFVLTDLNTRAVAHAVQLRPQDQPRCLIAKLDVSSLRDWQSVFGKALRTFERVDVLMNIAGFLRPGYVSDLDPADIEKHVKVNVQGVMLGTHFAAAHMRKRGSGHIVNIASLAGLSPVPGLALYSGSKFAVRGFSLSAHEELREFGVSVTTVCPGAVQTPMLTLQEQYPEASLTFSGPILTVDRLAQAIVRALTDRPRELIVPASFGLTAKIVGMFPAVGGLLKGLLLRKGRRKQAAMLANK